MSQMNPRRRSTVHDLAALRLHRDGTRVLNSDTNVASRRAKHAVRDARGNWIARDAGGLGSVKQRRSAPHDGPDGVEEDEEALDDVSLPPENGKGKRRAREDKDSDAEDALNPRARKRRRFDKDLSYLASRSSSAARQPANSEGTPPQSVELPGELPVPSSDLLKCLHYFASTYYTAMGQLYDATREVRKQRRARQLEKAKTTAKVTRANRAQSEGTSAYEPPHTPGDNQIKPSDEELEDAKEENSIDEQDTQSQAEKRVRKKRGRKQWRPMEKDMYRIFDGSALMAIGMLFQEQVAEMLEPRVPDGWEKEISLLEREKRAEAKRVRKAKRMWEKRHPVKKDSEEADEADESSGSESEEQRRSSTESDDHDDDEEESAGPSLRNPTLKQSSSVPLLGSSGSDE